METRFVGGQGGLFYGHGGGVPDYLSREKEGKRSLEWDLNDWKWDGDLFIATPLNSVPGDCRNRELLQEENRANVLVSNSSSSCSDEIDKGKRELEKRRRVVVYEDGEMNAEARNLTLKLGEHDYPIPESEGGNWDERNGKKSKLVGASSNRALCQVEDCKADLGNAKDYHRRHKVCEMHSKASKALVGNVMQRFCQQCSRFHLLQEFDEGKRSCRRRLAGHNKRRRKNHPDAVVNGGSLNDDRTSSYLLISLLKILSNMHSNNSDQTKNQDVLSHLLRNLVSNGGAVDGRNVCGLLQESQDLLNAGASAGVSSEVLPALPSNGHGSSRNLGSSFEINGDGVATQGTHMRTSDQLVTVTASKGVQNRTNLPSSPDGCQQTLTYSNFTTTFPANPSTQTVVPHSDARRSKINNFDLNSVYSDLQDCAEQLDGSQLPVSLGTRSPEFPPWMRKEPLQSSPPHTSGNSDSASTLSPSSSSGDTQNRTDRIVFKLFGKDPNDFPLVLRGQILDWLSHSPTDIESYIRPGCIVLTIYLRLAESTWQEITGDLSSSLSGLLNLSDDSFWRTGWAYTEVQHQIAFIHSGQVVLDIPLPLSSHNLSRIFAVTPIAVSVSERVQFTVKGFNLSQPTTRLLCALEGKYLLEEATHDLLDNDDNSKEHDELQHLTFPCSVPDVMGRGFIEVEDHGLSSDFFPFIVAEQDVCSEIRMLESVIEVAEFSNDTLGVCSKMEAKNQALDFIHEMGWLIHRSRVRSRVGHIDPMSDVFPFTRYQWLMDFSMDRDWCAVVNKLLDILFEGSVGSGDHSSAELALLELCLVHRAVRRSCRRMVELLLRYVPHKALLPADMESKQQVSGVSDSFFFRPDAIGPAGLTPLHIAASRDGSENLVDALTDDPGSVGVEAWKNVRDNTGSTPEDYARLRGHYSYIHLIHKKIKKTETEHVILDIPADLSDYSSKYKNAKSHSAKVSSLQIEKTATRHTQIQHYCKICDQQPIYGTRRSIVYRPAMLSMVAIAAVCVCVALLFKSSPEVIFAYPFRWEFLDYGPI